MGIDTDSFFGRFDNWNEAMRQVPNNGYENPLILQKVINSTDAVRRGEFAFESDGKCYNRKDYKYYLLCMLDQVVFKYGYLNIIEYGGSLGTLYYRHKDLLRFPVCWNIVEQKHYVDYGKTHIPELNFYYSIEECFRQQTEKPINCVMFAGSIEYLPDPYSILGKVFKKGISDIIIDTVQMGDMDRDWLSCQKIPDEIYQNTKYPIWLFSRSCFTNFFNQHKYNELIHWDHPWLSKVTAENEEIIVREMGGYWEKKN